jgi:hypothetical protein
MYRDPRHLLQNGIVNSRRVASSRRLSVIDADVLVFPCSTKRSKASMQALGHVMSGWEDRLHGEEGIP